MNAAAGMAAAAAAAAFLPPGYIHQFGPFPSSTTATYRTDELQCVRTYE